MKKLLLLICLAFAMNMQTYAQKTEYQSVFGNYMTSYNIWTEIYDAAWTDSACFVKDTLFNGLEYKEFFRKSIFDDGYERASFLLRENENHSKVYSLRIDESNFYTEQLVMDLELNLQDTFRFDIEWIEDGGYIVDSIFYDNNNMKHIRLFSENSGHYTYPPDKIEFIEGVGSTASFFIDGSILLPKLLCAYKDSVNVYTQNYRYWFESWNDKCFHEAVLGIDHVSPIKKIKIYPNPVNDFLWVDLGENFMQYKSIHVYNLLGKHCLNIAITQEKQLVETQKLPIGNYIIQVIGKGMQPIFGKFSVIR